MTELTLQANHLYISKRGRKVSIVTIQNLETSRLGFLADRQVPDHLICVGDDNRLYTVTGHQLTLASGDSLADPLVEEWSSIQESTRDTFMTKVTELKDMANQLGCKVSVTVN